MSSSEDDSVVALREALHYLRDGFPKHASHIQDRLDKVKRVVWRLNVDPEPEFLVQGERVASMWRSDTSEGARRTLVQSQFHGLVHALDNLVVESGRREPERGDWMKPPETRGSGQKAALWKVHGDLVTLSARTYGDTNGLVEDLQPIINALYEALGGKPYEVGEEVTGERATGCPVGTTLRCVTGGVAAFRTVNGWKTTVSPRGSHEDHVRMNHWRILELPEGES